MSEQIGSPSTWRRAVTASLVIATMLSTESCHTEENANQASIAIGSVELPPVSANINPQTGLINHTKADFPNTLSDNQTIPRCFTEPLKPQYDFGLTGPAPQRSNFKNVSAFDKALNSYFQTPLIVHSISLPFKDGRPSGMPADSPTRNVLSSIVKIDMKVGISDYWGSGFTTIDAHGKEVIVTAAHVGAVVPLKDLTISSMNGKTIHPNGGCYVNENIVDSKQIAVESFAPILPEGRGTSSIDLAILTLPYSIGNLALGFDAKQSQRGDWVQFTNFEQGSSLNCPANFYGLITSNYNEPLSALTGLSNQPNAAAAEVNRSAPGESGGLVSTNDKIVGLSFAGTDKPGYYDSPIDLATRNIFLPKANYGFDGGITPASAAIVGANTIELALGSSKA
jgi:hypothetical protein